MGIIAVLVDLERLSHLVKSAALTPSPSTHFYASHPIPNSNPGTCQCYQTIQKNPYLTFHSDTLPPPLCFLVLSQQPPLAMLPKSVQRPQTRCHTPSHLTTGTASTPNPRSQLSSPLMILFCIGLALLSITPASALSEDSLLPSSYRWFVEFTVQFSPPLHDVDAFARVLREIPQMLGEACFFHSDSFLYEPIISAQKHSYHLYTVVPSEVLGTTSSDSPDLNEIDHALDMLDGRCGEDHINRVIRKINLSHPSLQISRISTDLDVYNTRCVSQEANPRYQGGLNPKTVSNNQHNHQQGSTTGTNNTGTVQNSPNQLSSKRQLARIQQSTAAGTTPKKDLHLINLDNAVDTSGPIDEPQFLEHYVHGANCPKAAELMECQTDVDCNAEAGSHCKLHFNRRLKKNLNYCSLVTRWRDPFWSHVVIISLILLSFIYLAHALQSYDLKSCFRSFAATVKDDGLMGMGMGKSSGVIGNSATISPNQMQKMNQIHETMTKIHQNQAFVTENPLPSAASQGSGPLSMLDYALAGSISVSETIQGVFGQCVEGFKISLETLLPPPADLSYKNTTPQDYTQRNQTDEQQKYYKNSNVYHANGSNFSALIQNGGKHSHEGQGTTHSTNSNFAKDPSEKFKQLQSTRDGREGKSHDDCDAKEDQDDFYHRGQGGGDVVDEVTLIIPNSNSNS